MRLDIPERDGDPLAEAHPDRWASATFEPLPASHVAALNALYGAARLPAVIELGGYRLCFAPGFSHGCPSSAQARTRQSGQETATRELSELRCRLDEETVILRVPTAVLRSLYEALLRRRHRTTRLPWPVGLAPEPFASAIGASAARVICRCLARQAGKARRLRLDSVARVDIQAADPAIDPTPLTEADQMPMATSSPARRLEVPLRLDDSRGLSFVACLYTTCQGAHRLASVWARLDRSRLGESAAWRSSPAWLGALRWRAGLVVGSLALSLTQLRQLRVGDVVFPTPCAAVDSRPRGWLRFDDGQCLRVVGVANGALLIEHGDVDEAFLPPHPGEASAGDVMTWFESVHFDFDIKQLLELMPGGLLHPAAGPAGCAARIQLRCAGAILALGEKVSLGGRVGVRLLEFCLSSPETTALRGTAPQKPL